MIDWAHFSLWLALACAVIQAGAAVMGLQRSRTVYDSLAQRALSVHTLLMMLACAGLVNAFLKDDFSLLTVANHSHVDLPVFYKCTALWAGHEGSIVLWLLVTSLYAWLTVHSVKKNINQTKHSVRRFTRWVVLLFALLQTGFLLFCLFTSNPFTPAPMQGGLPYTLFGASLNPILQDPLMAIHPPILYAGYVGFVAPCVLIMAYLASTKRDSNKTLQINVFLLLKRWMLIAWSFLTLGIGLGSFWAYYELGWGGFWFWDPVENASLMPWLLAVAGIHSLNASIKYGRLKKLSALLAVSAFCCTLVGTFIVRSGLLSSVHTFSNDPSRGVVLLVLVGVFCLFVFALLFYTLERLVDAPFNEKHGLKASSILLLNAVLFISACFTVMLGTLAPIVYQLFFNQIITVGAPYFNAFLPYFVVMCLVMMVVASLLSRHTARLSKVRMVLLSACVMSLVCFATHTAFGDIHWVANSILTLIVVSLVMHVWPHVFTSESAPCSKAPFKISMHLAHTGFMVMCVGVLISTSYGVSSFQKITRGVPFNVAGYEFIWHSTNDVRQHPTHPHYTLNLHLTDGHKRIELNPQKRIYPTRETTTSETAIHSEWGKDIYAVMGDSSDGETWVVNIQYKPMIRWLWVGVLMMCCAGFIAVFITGVGAYKPKKIP